jgi:hypothetical protein
MTARYGIYLAADKHRPLGFSVPRLAEHGIAGGGGAQFGGATVTATVREMPPAVSVAVIV